MAYAELDATTREIAERVLTRKQLEALKLHLGGMSIRRMARALDVAPSTVEGRLFRARQRLSLELERNEAA